MKRALMITVLVAMILGVVMPTAVAAASTSPCCDAWFNCIEVKKNAYDEGCQLLFDVCMAVVHQV